MSLLPHPLNKLFVYTFRDMDVVMRKKKVLVSTFATFAYSCN